MFAIIVSRAIFLALFFLFAGDEFEERRKGLKRVGNVLLSWIIPDGLRYARKCFLSRVIYIFRTPFLIRMGVMLKYICELKFVHFYEV